jgi:hypothetical protein
MKQASPITTLFLDIGGVFLTKLRVNVRQTGSAWIE